MNSGTRFLGAALLMSVVAACGGENATNVLARPSAATGTPVSAVVAGGQVTVTYGALPGNARDWIAIAPSGSALTTYGAWAYTGGASSGTATFQAIGAGTWVARAFLNDGFTLSGESDPFTVTAATMGGGATITTDATSYAAGAPVDVSFTGASGAANDWIGIAAAGTPDSTWSTYKYTGGGASGTVRFDALPSGTWVARLYFTNGSVKQAESAPFTIASSGAASVTTDKGTYAAGERVVVTYAGMSGSSTDWIALALDGSADSTWVAWVYTGGGASGSVSLAAPSGGRYRARAYFNDTMVKRAESAAFDVATSAPPTVTTSSSTYAAGSSVVVNFANMKGSTGDWIGVRASTAPSTTYLDYKYTGAATSGSVTFDGLAQGTYVAAAYFDNNLTQQAVSAPFTVGPDCTAYPVPSGCPAIDYAIRGVTAPGATTLGGFTVTLTGTFPTSAAAQITMNGATITPSSVTSNSVAFVAPAGVGSAPIRLTVGGTVVPYATVTVSSAGFYQSILTDTAPFTYPAPTVSSVSGCVDDVGINAVGCSVVGGDALSITGTGFGTSAALISVTVGGVACTNVSFRTPQTRIQCTLPARQSGGFDLPVVVTVAGTASLPSAATVSYFGPTITAVPSPPTAAVGGETLTVQGRFFNTTATVTLYSGSAAIPCGPLSGTVDPVTQNATMTCTLPPGGGTNLDVVVTQGTIASRRFPTALTYAAPVVGLVRAPPTGSGTSSLTLGGNDPQTIYLDATRIGIDASQIAVFYGPPSNPHAHRCGSVALISGGLRCVTEGGTDGPHALYVKVNNGAEGGGTTTITFPTGAQVIAIRGCASDSGNGTSGCATVGGTLVTLTLSFAPANDPVLFTVDGRTCDYATWISSTQVRCALPPGGGVPKLALRVGNQPATFASGVTLDYAVPTITRVSGCQDVGMTTIGCTAGTTLTQWGQGFGPEGGVVLVGGALCGSLRHDSASPDSRMTCTLPTGSGLNREVQLLDVSARTSNIVYLSY